MKTDTSTGHFSNVLLTGTLLMAQLDFQGFLDYGIKAVLGGAIWLGFKTVADHLDQRRKRKPN